MPSRSWLDLPRLALAAIVVNVGIVLTGGVVRVTGSGLGCPDWPRCEGDRVVPGGSDAGWHQAIEFGNRLLTFVVLAVAVAVYVAARRRTDDVTTHRLAALLPVGVLLQAVLGGVTVLTGLHPLTVAAHFLVSMVLIAVAVVLHQRVRGGTDPHAAEHPADRSVRVLVITLTVMAAAVLVLGTVVTAAGPHAGDPGTVRLGVDIRTVARLHAGAVWLVVAATVAVLVRARSVGHVQVHRVAGVLLAIEVVQGAVGYTQYALGIPAALVAVHILLAALFWVAVVRVAHAALRTPETVHEAVLRPAQVGT